VRENQGPDSRILRPETSPDSRILQTKNPPQKIVCAFCRVVRENQGSDSRIPRPETGPDSWILQTKNPPQKIVRPGRRNSQGEEKKRMGVSPSVFVSPVCLPSALTRERRKSRLINAALHKGSLSPPALAPASASGVQRTTRFDSCIIFFASDQSW